VKVLIMTLGTRGDVQPFVALALGLTAAGHDTVLVAPHRFAEFVTSRGVCFAGVDDGPLRLMDEASPVVGDMAEHGLRATLALARRMPAMFTTVLEDCWTVAADGPGHDADLVVHNGQIIAGQHVAEKLAKPAVLALPLPVYVPTREFPWPGQATPLPRTLNRLTFAGMRGPELMFGHTVDRWRATIGLPRRRWRHDPRRRPDGAPAPVLHAISRHVLPRPADWPATATVTGYWFLPGTEPLPPALVEFLDAGDPPVFVGFGSMAGPDPAATTATVLAGVRRAGMRAVVGTGWGGLTTQPADTTSDDVFVVHDVPFDLLFPRVAAVVHHGGAGTIAIAAATGKPQVVCPFVADQPFWGRRMHDLGVAPEPIRQRHLTADRLAAAIEQTIAEHTAAAAELGELVRAENGLRDAVRELETTARN
jgi:sterol 3beta-glucosyltransferase